MTYQHARGHRAHASAGMDRRTFLRRLGIGVAGAGGVVLLPGGGRALSPADASGPDIAPDALVTSAGAGGGTQFGFMFPELRPFKTDFSDTGEAVAAIAALATTMVDPDIKRADYPVQASPANPNGHRDNTGMGSAFTYAGGQFTDHDITLDLEAQPTAFFTRDERGLLFNPQGEPVINFETFALDLSSVYGGGPDRSPQLYMADKLHFIVQEDNGNGVRDLPRNSNGSAVLVEHRNDENEIILQAHVAFLKFHNAMADAFPNLDFEGVRDLVLKYYQWAYVSDILPHFCGPQVVEALRNGSLPRFYQGGFTPFEFTGACYRFGHSIVRKAYAVNDFNPDGSQASPNAPFLTPVFNSTDGDLHGGRPLPAFKQIEWGNFFPELNENGPNGGDVNFARLIDPLISQGLFGIPIGGLSGAEVSGSSVLPFRNMLRGFFYGLPSGQDVAQAMGITPHKPTEVIDPSIKGFTSGTPLWYYILFESFLEYDGIQLGSVGGRIVADVGLSFIDRLQGFVPVPPIAQTPGEFQFSDLFVFAGVANRPGSGS